MLDKNRKIYNEDFEKRFNEITDNMSNLGIYIQTTFIEKGRRNTDECEGNIKNYRAENDRRKKLLDEMEAFVESIHESCGFHIHSAGEPNVGIFSQNWTLQGDFFFDSGEELEDFRLSIEGVFKNKYADDVRVETFEANDIRIMRERVQNEQFGYETSNA